MCCACLVHVCVYICMSACVELRRCIYVCVCVISQLYIIMRWLRFMIILNSINH